MIRFSAALVAVAIGVLIGGIATSKLLLVYIAIVVSAVALVALAIGVVLKRKELFGEGQVLPAGAGAGPVLQARAAESQDQVPASAHVAPPPPFQGAAGGHAAVFGGTASAASSPAAPPSAAAGPSAASPSAGRTATAGQGRSADPVPPWNTPAARGPWSSSTPDWMHSGPDERLAGAAGSPSGRAPSAWQDTTPAGTPGGRAGGWGVPDADRSDRQAAEKAPRSWATPSPPSVSSVSSDTPAVKPGAGSGSATPSWFDRLGSQEGADAPAAVPPSVPASATDWSWSRRDSNASGGPIVPEAAEGTSASPTVAAPVMSSDTVSGGTLSGETASGDTDEDDDWPTRYSWLDDDTDESGEAGATAATDVADLVGAGLESKSPVAGDTEGDTAGDTAGDAGLEDGTAVAASAPGTPSSAAETADAATPDAAASDRAASDRADAAERSGADIIAFPGQGASGGLSQATDPGTHDGPAGEAGADHETAAAGEAGSEPPATAEGGAAPGAGLVTVVPGVPRYHRTDCVLIRFMPEGDVQLLSVTAAKDAGCTPCAACQPEG